MVVPRSKGRLPMAQETPPHCQPPSVVAAPCPLPLHAHPCPPRPTPTGFLRAGEWEARSRMRVGALRAAQPSPTRSVTQSRRLAGTCAVSSRGCRGRGAGCRVLGAAGPAPTHARPGLMLGTWLSVRCSQRQGRSWSGLKSTAHSNGCHRARRAPVEAGARAGSPSSAPLQMSAWPSDGPPGLASRLRGGTRDTEALRVLQVPSAQFTSSRRFWGPPGAAGSPLAVHHLQMHTPACWKPPLPAW